MLIYNIIQLKSIVEGTPFDRPELSYDEGRELLCPIVEHSKPAPQQMASYGSEKEEEEDKGFFGTWVDAAKDIGKIAKEKVTQAGKVIAQGTTEAGKIVAEKTKSAATTVWEKGKSITVKLNSNKCNQKISAVKKGITKASDAIKNVFLYIIECQTFGGIFGTSEHQAQSETDNPVPESEENYRQMNVEYKPPIEENQNVQQIERKEDNIKDYLDSDPNIEQVTNGLVETKPVHQEEPLNAQDWLEQDIGAAQIQKTTSNKVDSFNFLETESPVQPLKEINESKKEAEIPNLDLLDFIPQPKIEQKKEMVDSFSSKNGKFLIDAD